MRSVAQIARLSAGLLLLAPNTDAERSKNSFASQPTRARCYTPCATIGDGAWPLMEDTRQSSSDHAKSAV
jgi:hypothetical protein